MAAKKKSKSGDLGTAATDGQVKAPEVRVVSDVEANAFDLDRHLIRLMWDEPFFSHIIRGVTKIRTEEIPTAGVLAKDGDIKFWWNPKFLCTLTPDQILGLIIHECFHLAFEHTTTRRYEPHIVWNYATDLAINSMIPKGKLPDGGLLPGQPFEKLSDEQLVTPWTKDLKTAHKTVSDLIASLPLGQSSEWYFSQLMDVAEEIKQLNGEGFSVNFDDHEGWGEMSDEERDLVRGKVRQAIIDAIRKSDSSGHWGSVPAETRAMLRELVSGEVPWQSILKQFCGFSRRADRESSHRRLNRKYTGIQPGAKRSYTSSIAIYIDQSGSVGNEDLELFFGELMNLARHTEFTLFNFDTEVDLKSERTWCRTKTPGLTRTRCGGTDFSAPSKHATANASRFDGYLIMTDGEAADPGPSKGIRRGWVICPNRKLLFTPPHSDIIVPMKGKKATPA